MVPPMPDTPQQQQTSPLNHHLQEVPSPSSMMIDLIDTNISPNPVVLGHHHHPNNYTDANHTTTGNTTTTTSNLNTTKRVEFNFVPSMRMFENDHKIDTNDDHQDDDDPLLPQPISSVVEEEELHEGNSSSATTTTTNTNKNTATTTTTTTTTTTSTTGSNSSSNHNNHVVGGAVLWDTETDHMLSYFLSGNDQGPSATIDFTTMPSASITTTTTTTEAMNTNPTVRDSTFMTRTADNKGSHNSTDDTRSTSNTTTQHNDHHHVDGHDHHHIPPPTPAVQFYSNSCTPLSSNVYNTRTGNTLHEENPSRPKNDSHSTQPPHLQPHIYPAWSSHPPLTGGSTSTTTTATTATQSQSSSSSSLSSLANHHQVQLYHQQLQMQRLLAGSGGGSNTSNTTAMYFSSLSQPQPSQQQLSPLLPNNNSNNNNRLYPQMLLYPPPVPASHGTNNGGDSQQQQQQPPSSMNLFDGESPLSPAAMIGTPSQHENLFLPRSNSFYENTSKKNPQDTSGDTTMGPPVSRQPSQNDILSAMASTTLTSTGGFVWPPPGTMSSSPSAMSNPHHHHHHHPRTTTIPTLPFHMMAPFLANPLTSTTTSTTHEPMIHNNNMPSLLPNLQPFMYTTNTISQQHEPSSMMSTSNGTIPAAASLSQSPAPTQPPNTEEESEEKRNKRLERNRESARKCRLKKKERLHTLGMQVTELHKRIEQERRTIINNMVPILMQHCRQHEIMSCNIANTIDSDGNDGQQSSYHANGHNSNNPLIDIIRGSGPSSTMMRSVLEFQYSTLKDITLPHYEKLLLWFTTQKESFYTIGKEQYYIEQQRKIKQQQSSRSSPAPNINESNEAANPSVAVTDTAASSGYSATTNIRPNSIKISSKQIGEELMTGISSSNDDAPSKKRSSKSNGTVSGGITSSAVYDGAKTWPLFCYELKLSVDQEERFVGKHKQIIFEDDRQVKVNRDTTSESTYRSLSYIREEMAVAVTTTESLGKAVGTLSHMIAQRDENTYLNVLHPPQVSRYYHWLSLHRTTVRQMMLQHKIDVTEHATTASPSTIDMDSDPSTAQSSLSSTTAVPYEGKVLGDSTSLHAISRRLSEVLQISSRQQYRYSNGESRNSNQNK